MHVRFESQSDLEDAMLLLVKQDPRLKPILELTGMPALRQREALAVYDELARRHPEQPGYAAIVKILKRRLVERCKDKQPGESPCPPAP